MPRLDRDPDFTGPFVRGFRDGGFAIEDSVYRAALLTPERALDWRAPTLAALALADIEPILGLRPPPEFILLGTGARFAFPPAAFRDEIEARGIGMDAMDSRAAARAWGLLRGEGRWIAAALMALDQG